MPAKPETVRVYPSPSLSPVEYVPGVGADGADIPRERAEALLASGAVTTTRPKPADAAAAAPEKE